MADFSYDITKYTDVDSLFGNLAMFDELLERMQALMQRYSQQKRR
jgi:glycosidase